MTFTLNSIPWSAYDVYDGCMYACMYIGMRRRERMRGRGRREPRQGREANSGARQLREEAEEQPQEEEEEQLQEAEEEDPRILPEIGIFFLFIH